MANLSVIVPIYNTSKYLDRCIDSISEQTYRDLEIILVDDGSNDNSLEICKRHAALDKRIRIISKQNGGQSSARNAGLDIASSRYITFVDSDDYIAPMMYEVMMSHKSIGLGECELVLCDSNVVSEDETTNCISKYSDGRVLSADQMWEEIFGKLNNAVWNKIYIKDVIGDLRFALNIVHGEDLLFNLQYLLKCKQGLLYDVKLYNYVQRKDSVTGRPFSKTKLFEIESKDLAYEIVRDNHPTILPTAARYRFRARLNVLRSIYRSGLEEEYKDSIDCIQNYLISNKSKDWKYLKNKDRFEYFLLVNFKHLYKNIIRLR